MAKVITGKLIPAAAIVVLAIAAVPDSRAGSAPNMVNARQQAENPANPGQLCPVPAWRVCRPVRGKRPAYHAQTPLPAPFRAN